MLRTGLTEHKSFSIHYRTETLPYFEYLQCSLETGKSIGGEEHEVRKCKHMSVQRDSLTLKRKWILFWTPNSASALVDINPKFCIKKQHYTSEGHRARKSRQKVRLRQRPLLESVHMVDRPTTSQECI